MSLFRPFNRCTRRRINCEKETKLSTKLNSIKLKLITMNSNGADLGVAAIMIVTLLAFIGAGNGQIIDTTYSDSQIYSVTGTSGTFTVGPNAVSEMQRSFRSNVDKPTAGVLAWSGQYCSSMQVSVGWGTLDGTTITPQWSAQGEFETSTTITPLGTTVFTAFDWNNYGWFAIPWASGPNVHYFLSFECPLQNTGIRFYDFFTLENCSPSAIASTLVNYTISATTWVTSSNAVSIHVWNPTGAAPLYTACGLSSSNWMLYVTTINGSTPSTGTLVAFSDTSMTFRAPGSITAQGTYVVELLYNLGPTSGIGATFGLVQVVQPQLTTTAVGRYFGWNTFDRVAGGELAVYGTGFGPSCDVGQWTLRSMTNNSTLGTCATIVNSDSNGGQVIVFAIPPAAGGALGQIGYNDTYQPVYASQSPSPVTLTTTKIPILYGFANTDHDEELTWDMSWTGPWSGSASRPVSIARKGPLVLLSLLDYPFNGGTYTSGAVITSTTFIPERFRPLVPVKRCYAHVRFSGTGNDLHMDVTSAGQLKLYKTASGGSFTSSPNIYPATCVWDMTWH